MRRAIATGLLTACVLVASGAGVDASEPRQVALEGPRDVQGLRRADVDGDGIPDLLLLQERSLRVWRAVRGKLPPAKPTWQVTVPDEATFLDVHPAAPGSGPALVALGTRGAVLLPLKVGSKPIALPGAEALTWRDERKATFADVVVEGGVLLPLATGWRYRATSDAASFDLPLARQTSVEAPGPFLEDSCAVAAGLPRVWVGASAHAEDPAAARCLWALEGRRLVAQTAGRRVTYDVAFLGDEGDQRLVDLDGDERPEIIHRVATNRDARYGFFRTKPASGDAVPSHKPARSTLYLSGFQLDPELLDLDGDGFRDLVVTAMQINPQNTLRALTSGKVTAETHAFLNRWGSGGTRYFERQPDATVTSDVGVKVRFDYAGTVEVQRSLTILADGDYDGDGRRDLAIRTGEAVLTVRRGTADGVWQADGIEMAIPAPDGHPRIEGYALDVDGDGRDEIVLAYRKPPGGSDKVWVFDPGW